MNLKNASRVAVTITRHTKVNIAIHTSQVVKKVSQAKHLHIIINHQIVHLVSILLIVQIAALIVILIAITIRINQHQEVAHHINLMTMVMIPALLAEVDVYQKMERDFKSNFGNLPFEWKKIVENYDSEEKLVNYREEVKKQLQLVEQFAGRIREQPFERGEFPFSKVNGK